jgi:hypothetical protein
MADNIMTDEQFGIELASVVRDYCAPLITRLAALEARLHHVETLTPKYLGVFKLGKSYSENSMVTHHGSVWFCNKTTDATPGNGSADWVLMVKRGSDGKDVRDDA